LSGTTIHATRIREATAPEVLTQREILEAYLEDASGAPPGQAAGLIRPESEAEAAAFLRQSLDAGTKILFQAARTSLTAGAIPRGEVVLSVERMGEIGRPRASGNRARALVQPGVRLDRLQAELAPAGWFFPPVPTYQQAMLGGAASTNAGGAATFKYGVTRQWVHALRLLLFNGDLLEIERGQATARRGERFSIHLSTGEVLHVPVPDYSLPDLKKISAGYYSADPIDLVDLFVGSEGTLGLITAITVDLAPLPPAVVTALAFLGSDSAALELAGDLRRAALRARDGTEPQDPDVRSIELLDGHCLALVREHGVASKLRVSIPETARAALLFETELVSAMTNDDASRILESALAGGGADHPLARLFHILEHHDVVGDLQFAFPDDAQRRKALSELREAVPTRVSELIAERHRQSTVINKLGGDLIVPFEHVPEMMSIYRAGFERRGLEYAIWGHLSDGNLHPNAIPHSAGEAAKGQEALLEFADHALRLGGCPLSEHGVGRNPLKQETMRRFLGEPAIESMRAIKGALDPPWRLAPGVLFPPPRY
jgi:D-lactate dehydrogenase (cytochrome)